MSTQKREKQKGVEKRQIRETKYYRQGMAITNHLAATDQWPQFRPNQKDECVVDSRLRGANLSALTTNDPNISFTDSLQH